MEKQKNLRFYELFNKLYEAQNHSGRTINSYKDCYEKFGSEEIYESDWFDVKFGKI